MLGEMIDKMIEPKYKACNINPDKDIRIKMAYLMLTRYNDEIKKGSACVKGVYKLRDFIKKVNPNSILKAVKKLENNAK